MHEQDKGQFVKRTDLIMIGVYDENACCYYALFVAVLLVSDARARGKYEHSPHLLYAGCPDTLSRSSEYITNVDIQHWPEWCRCRNLARISLCQLWRKNEGSFKQKGFVITSAIMDAKIGMADTSMKKQSSEKIGFLEGSHTIWNSCFSSLWR